MLDELSQAIAAYKRTWDKLVESRTDKNFFQSFNPTAVAWKTTDLVEFDQRFVELREKCDQIHLGWINERWIATMHLMNPISSGIQIVKLMQRRPGSTDAVGLDHLDFYSPDAARGKEVLSKEPDLKWSEEDNGRCKWLSIWFDDTEAKLRTGTVVDVCIQELEEVKDKLLT